MEDIKQFTLEMEDVDCRKTKKLRTIVTINTYVNGELEEEYMFYAPSHKQDYLIEQLTAKGYKRAYDVSYYERLVEEREHDLDMAKLGLDLSQVMLKRTKEHPIYEEPSEQEFHYEI